MADEVINLNNPAASTLSFLGVRSRNKGYNNEETYKRKTSESAYE